MKPQFLLPLDCAEIWKYVEGYEGYYQVSSLGQCRSVNRTNVNKRRGTKVKWKGRYISITYWKDDYGRLQLNKDGDSRTHFIHRLVATAFVPNPFNLPEVNHKKGNKRDNRASQLEWGTKSDNEKHAHRTGLKDFKGESGIAKRRCDTKTVLEIRKLHEKEGVATSDLATRYKIPYRTIYHIVKRTRWTHI